MIRKRKKWRNKKNISFLRACQERWLRCAADRRWFWWPLPGRSSVRAFSADSCPSSRPATPRNGWDSCRACWPGCRPVSAAMPVSLRPRCRRIRQNSENCRLPLPIRAQYIHLFRFIDSYTQNIDINMELVTYYFIEICYFEKIAKNTPPYPFF